MFKWLQQFTEGKYQQLINAVKTLTTLVIKEKKVKMTGVGGEVLYAFVRVTTSNEGFGVGRGVAEGLPSLSARGREP